MEDFRGDKDQPFGQTFCALGVEISFKSWSKGIAVWQNTKRRIRELVETIDKILEAGELAQPLALSLRGRMQFARCQIWGRSSKICLNAITNHAYGGPSKKLSPEVKIALCDFKFFLLSSGPREIGQQLQQNWYIFTDASFQPEDPEWPCGLGGVLFDRLGKAVSAFSLCLNPEQRKFLGYPGKKTIIFETELLALVVSMLVWKIVQGLPLSFLHRQ